VFENRVLRKIYGPTREEMVGGWRRLHDELHNLYISPNNIREITSGRVRWAGNVAGIGKIRNSYKIVVKEPKGKRPCKRSRYRWEDNIRLDLRGTEWKVVD
jgi:hypothetical protein